MPDQQQPARCAIGLLLWQDIDTALADYKKVASTERDRRLGSLTVTNTIAAYYTHKHGNGEDLKPCGICGGKHE